MEEQQQQQRQQQQQQLQDLLDDKWKQQQQIKDLQQKLAMVEHRKNAVEAEAQVLQQETEVSTSCITARTAFSYRCPEKACTLLQSYSFCVYLPDWKHQASTAQNRECVPVVVRCRFGAPAVRKQKQGRGCASPVADLPDSTAKFAAAVAARRGTLSGLCSAATGS